MGLKDFFKNRKLKRAQKSNGFHLQAESPTIADDQLCILWTKCQGCNELLYTSELKKNDSVCKHCEYHHRLTAQERIDLLTDYGSFLEIDEDILPADPLDFQDLKAYKNRLEEARKSANTKEAIITGLATINSQPIAIGAMEFQYIGGSMGSVVGEKIVRLAEKSIEKRIPLILVSSSGGARMHEGILSLMQMAKTASALKKLHDEKLLYISLLTEPTFGGVTASFAMLGDILIAETQARIGFAGRRVIEETIKQKLPKNFQTAEYLLENGQIDMVVHRKELKQRVSELIRLHNQNKPKDFNGRKFEQIVFGKLFARV